ncbi:MAG: glycosyltransferase [Acidobacteria bacterium]|nr:glycosyltransferase [Acidobacteriota bacterium]
MTPLRVVLAIDEIYQWQGGTEKQLRLLLEHLPRHGAEARLLTIHGSPHLAGLPFPTSVLGLPLKRYLAPLVLARARRELRRVRADAVLAFFPMARWLVLRAAASAGVPVRVSTRRNFGLTEDAYASRGLARWNRHATHILCNSRRLVQRVAEVERPDGTPVEYLPNLFPLEPAPPHPDRPSGEWNVVLVANLRPVKRVDVFVRAAAALAREVPQARFHVAGDGPQRAALEALARELGTASRVVFHGPVGDVPALLAAMDAAVLTSETEGSSNAILEYMAAGLPVIATDTGGNPELVRADNGVLVPPGDPAALAAALARLTRDPAAVRRMGAASRAIVEREHDAAIVAPLYIDYIADRLQQRRAASLRNSELMGTTTCPSRSNSH